MQNTRMGKGKTLFRDIGRHDIARGSLKFKRHIAGNNTASWRAPNVGSSRRNLIFFSLFLDMQVIIFGGCESHNDQQESGMVEVGQSLAEAKGQY
jgi:hypothetical protein